MNELAVITGGSKGIGRALVDHFAKKGFDIATCSRHNEDLTLLKNEVEKKFPGVQLHYQQADLAVKTGVNNFITFCQNLSSPPRVLINNTGAFVPGQVHNEDEGVLEQMIAVNLYSAYHLTRGLINGMMRLKSGHIFNICSVASIMAYTIGGSYCIAKHALLGMSRVLREEMKEFNIKVTAVLPGATLTDSWAGVELPPERFMRPEDIAAAVYSCFSLSDQSVIEELLIRPQLGDI